MKINQEKDKNLSRLKTEELQEMIFEAVRNDTAEDLDPGIYREIQKRHRKAIFKKACKVLKLKGYMKNQFEAAARYADCVINNRAGRDYFETDSEWEIASIDTKMGSPVIVDLNEN